ncbi:MAG: carbohydrate ABC transporter permease [Bacteroidota bacterium]
MGLTSTCVKEDNTIRKQSRWLRIRKEATSWLFIIPSLMVFIFFVWQPLISTFYLSLFKTVGFNAVKFIGFGNYVDIMTNTEFIGTLLNTVKYVFWSLLIGFLVPIVAGIFISEMVHLGGFFRFAVYFPTMIPIVAVSMLWQRIYDPGPQGALNAILIGLGMKPFAWLSNPGWSIPLIIIMATWGAFGGTTMLYVASFQGINQELYEAAAIDGANIRQRIRHIALPGIANMLSLMLIVQIVTVFQMYIQPMIMTNGGPQNASMTLILKSYNYAFATLEAGKSTATGVVTFCLLFIPALIYYRRSQRHDTQGVG